MKLNHTLVLGIRILYGLPMVIFGLNKFFGFADVAPPEDPTAQMFLGAMFSSYLANSVGILEVVGGLLIAIPRTAFIGWLILLPVISNIVLFHLAHDLPGNGLWLLPTILAVVTGITFKSKLTQLIQ